MASSQSNDAYHGRSTSMRSRPPAHSPARVSRWLSSALVRADLPTTMLKPPRLLAEAERQAALDRYAVLDSLPEAEFDDVTAVAASICSTPIALVSLIDDDRQWFKSKVGISATETPRDISFCGHAIGAAGTLFVVPDTHEDERFHDNPLVTGEPYLRFYAGVQLRTPDGFCLGTLCIADRKPRQLTPEQEHSLRALARIVMRSLGTRRTLLSLRGMYDEACAVWETEDLNKRSRR